MKCTSKTCVGSVIQLVQQSHQGRIVHRCTECNTLYAQAGYELGGKALDNRTPDARQAEEKKR